MSTTLANALTQLSKEIGDYWNSTSTSAGSSTTVVDTALCAKANDWISDAPHEMYDRITSGTYDGEERKISSLDNTTGTLTTLAHGGTIASGVTYEVHRLATASDKRIALVQACKTSFPNIYKKINDTSKTTGNWLLNGDVEVWTSSSACTSWTAVTSTITQTSTALYYKRGSYSMKISAASGYVKQDWGLNDRLKDLRGKTVTFEAQGWCDTASCLRLAIYDGTTTTYSDYHDGDSTWTDDDDVMSVSATISDTATDVSFRVYHAEAAGISYVDDMRVTGPQQDRIYIGDLGLALDWPHTVEYNYDTTTNFEPWQTLHNYDVDSDGYLLLPSMLSDCRLRIKGIGYLDFLASGASSTAWTATVAVDSPQLLILTAAAVVFLYTTFIMPNYTSGEREEFAKVLQYWSAEYDNRVAKFGMKTPGIKTDWGI